MMRKNKLLVSLLGVVLTICAMLALLTLAVAAEESGDATAPVTSAEPSVAIVGQSISLKNALYVNYYVQAQDVDETQVKLLTWKTAPAGGFTIENAGEGAILTPAGKSGDYIVFNFTDIPAKAIADKIYARAYVQVNGTDVYSTDVIEYSPLQYCLDTLNDPDAPVALKDLCRATIAYGAAAQTYFDYNTENLATDMVQIKVVNPSGTTVNTYRKGQTLTIVADNTNTFIPFAGWKNAAGEVVSTSAVYTFAASETCTLTANYTEITHYAQAESGPYVRTTHLFNADTMTLTGKSYPFYNKEVVFSDIADGKLTLTQGTTTYEGWIDEATGYVVFFTSGISTPTSVMLFVPCDSTGIKTADCGYLKIDNNTVLINYLNYAVLIADGDVKMGVSFVDSNGDALKLDDFKKGNSGDTLLIKKGAQTLCAFVKGDVADSYIKCDAFIGDYTNGAETLKLNGNGGAVYNGNAGTYVINGDAIDLFVNGTYYAVTVDASARTFVAEHQTATISFVTAYGTQAPVTVEKKIPYTLPVLTDGTNLFQGWYLDETFTTPAGTDYLPTGDVTLYASWKVSAVLPVVIDENTTVNLSVGVGNTVLFELEKLDLGLDAGNKDMAHFRKFLGWYYDSECTMAVSEGDVIPDEIGDVQIYAKWQSLPLYYGTFTGSKFYQDSVTSTNYYNFGGVTVTIDENGNITIVIPYNKTSTSKTTITGKVKSYNADEQVLIWNETGKTVDYKMFYDATSGVIAFGNSETNPKTTEIDMSVGYVVATRNESDGIAESWCGIRHSDTYSYQTIFLGIMETAAGNQAIMIENNKIYVGVTITDAYGNAKTPAEIRNETTLVVRHGDETLLAISAIPGKVFNNSSSKPYYINLDAVVGVYTNGADRIALNGIGDAIYTVGGVEKAGTYEVVDGIVGVTFEDCHLEFTLDLAAKTYTVDLPVVSVTFDSATLGIAVKEVNKKFSFVLPVPENTSEKTFKGWYRNADFEGEPVTELAPAGDTTVYGKWVDRVDVIAVYNDGATDDLLLVLGANDVVTIAKPTLVGRKFAGWFTTADFQEGTEFVIGETAVTANVKIYAKWVEAPKYFNDYVIAQVYAANNGYYTSTGKTSYTIAFDAEGVGSFITGTSSSAPFMVPNDTNHAKMEILDYADAGNGTHSFVYHLYYETTSGYGSNVTVKENNKYYRGVLDDATGILFFHMTAADTKEAAVEAKMRQCYMMIPTRFDDASTYQSERIVHSVDQVDDINQRFLTYTDQNGVVRNFFLNNFELFTDVTFVDLNGNAVAAQKAYRASAVLVKKGETIVAKLGYDGSKLVALDDKAGVYTAGDDTLTVFGNGLVSINGNAAIRYTVDGDKICYTTSGNEYFEATLNVDEKTAVIEKVMVTITFETEIGTVDALSVNKTIATALPTPIDASGAKIFIGWYVSGDETKTIVSQDYVALEDVTLVALWKNKVTLTVVYGHGVANGTVEYSEGSTLDMDAVKIGLLEENGTKYRFDGFYADAAFVTAFTDTVINADITVYAKYVEGMAYEVTNNGKKDPNQTLASSNAYAWADNGDGSFSSTNQKKGSSYSYIRYDFLAGGVFSFDYTVSSEANWDILYVTYNKLSASRNDTEIGKNDDGTPKQNPCLLKKASGTASGSYSVTVSAGDYILIFYGKDSGGDKGTDTATISNIQFA